jgi:hypothetical protein
MNIETADALRAFTQAILHGDDVHRAWLVQAAEAYIAGGPMPPVQSKPVIPLSEISEVCRNCGCQENNR